MMKLSPDASWMSFSNILYIGEEAKDCIAIIEKFNDRLREIERYYAGCASNSGDQYTTHFKLQPHIQYHFEGGIAIFKFKNEEEIPDYIREECLEACRSLAFEQAFFAS